MCPLKNSARQSEGDACLRLVNKKSFSSGEKKAKYYVAFSFFHPIFCFLLTLDI
jgi:hypothetical protein